MAQAPITPQEAATALSSLVSIGFLLLLWHLWRKDPELGNPFKGLAILPKVRRPAQLGVLALAFLALGLGWRLSYTGHPMLGLALLVGSWLRWSPEGKKA